MEKRVLYIPIDDRPCTFRFTVRMGGTAGCRIIVPPEHLLGKYQKPGNCEDLLNWLQNQEEAFDFSIICVDMPIYGGLVASRRMDDSPEKVLARLEKLKEIITRKRNNLGRIYLFSALLRTAPTYSDETLVPVIQKIIDYSSEYYLAEKGDPSAEKNLEKLEKEIPGHLLSRYLETRARNNEVNLNLIDLTEKGIADFLLIGIDDSKTTGMNILEKDELIDEIIEKKLNDKIIIAPGTDESASLLLARALSDENSSKTSVYPIFSSPEGKKNIPRYEDRSYQDIVELHILVSGCRHAPSRREADILLYVNIPVDRQKEASSQKYRITDNALNQNFVNSIVKSIKSGRRVVLADTFYANGADLSLMEELRIRVNLLTLYGFAAWNTAGNTIGSALSQGVIRYLAENRSKDSESEEKIMKNHILLLLERFADDWFYQSEIRQKLSTEAMVNQISVFHLDDWTEHFTGQLKNYMKDRVAGFYESTLKNYRVDLKSGQRLKLEKPDIRAQLPWGRLFEVDVDVDLSLISG